MKFINISKDKYEVRDCLDTLLGLLVMPKGMTEFVFLAYNTFCFNAKGLCEIADELDNLNK